MKLWCYNWVAIYITSNLVFHEKTKHIEVDCRFIREKVNLNHISTSYVRVGKQQADLFSKALG